MTFSTYYSGADTGLGFISNVAGTAIAYLDKVLVNGYNSTTLTSMTQVGTLVTATLAAHGYRDRQFVIISGATPSGYNGTWQIIVGSTTANTFQFNTVTSGMGSATGTLGCIVAPLGWTKAFSGTNLAAYKQLGGNGLYLRLDDTGTTTALMRGYETMSDINTGINPFPTTTQSANGYIMSKAASGQVNSYFWGNSSLFWLFTDYSANNSSGVLTNFGDGISYKTGDAWFTVVAGQAAGGGFEGWGFQVPAATATYIGNGTAVCARSFTAIPGSVNLSRIPELRFCDVGQLSASVAPLGGAIFTMVYPQPSDGNLWTSPVYMGEVSALTPRGYMPGSLHPIHNRPIGNYVIFQGTGALAGKEYLAINLGASGQCFAEISNTW